MRAAQLPSTDRLVRSPHRSGRGPAAGLRACLVGAAVVCAAVLPAARAAGLAGADELRTADDPGAASPADAALAEQVLAAANRYRASQQLPALQPSTELAALAAEHSQRMARLGRLSHAGFEQRFDRARRQTCVENLAAGFVRAEPVIAGWRVSPDHHRNLLDARVQDVGVASVAGHLTWLACSGR